MKKIEKSLYPDNDPDHPCPLYIIRPIISDLSLSTYMFSVILFTQRQTMKPTVVIN